MRRNRAERKDWDESTRVDGGTYKKRTHCQHSNRARVVQSSLELRGPRLVGWAVYSMAVLRAGYTPVAHKWFAEASSKQSKIQSLG